MVVLVQKRVVRMVVCVFVCVFVCKGGGGGVIGLVGNGWSVDWSARRVEIKVQRSGLRVPTSHFFRGRGQLDDLIFRGLADYVFVFLG